MILKGTEANPRRIKRFINTFYVTAEMRKAAGENLNEDDVRRLTLVLLTQMRFQEVFNDLTDAPGLIADYIEAIELPASERDPRIERNAALGRIFSRRQSRDFFELARNFDCTASQMRRWVLITAGDALT